MAERLRETVQPVTGKHNDDPITKSQYEYLLQHQRSRDPEIQTADRRHAPGQKPLVVQLLAFF